MRQPPTCLYSRFINPPATEYNSTHLLATQASSRLPLSVTTNSQLPSNDLARCQIPTVPLAIYQLVSHNMHGFSCPNSHNKFMAYFKTACLPQVLKKGICSSLFSVAYQNSDLHYDVCQLRPLEIQQLY